MSMPVFLDQVLYAEEGWESHPFAQGLEQKVLLSKGGDQGDITIFAFRAAAGQGQIPDVPPHVHEGSDDISYLIQGNAKIEIEGRGTCVMRPDTFVRVPKGLRHRVFDVSSDFISINIFAPATI